MEQFSLGKNREEFLDQLIPGSKDYYYYHCLYHQHQEDFEKAEEVLSQWINQCGHDSRTNEIGHRQALLTYEKDPKKTLLIWSLSKKSEDITRS